MDGTEAMKIGVPKERRAGETRVAISPDTVKKYVDLGIEVAVETGAGDGSNIPDQLFQAAGATIAPDAAAAIGNADLVLKVQRPLTAAEGNDELAAMIAVNVTGVMYCCREAARRMSTRHGGAGGAIVNVTSLAVTIGGRPGAAAYAGSKAAIDNFSTGFAREVAAEGIRVNTVRPGVTATGMTTNLAQDPDLRRRVEASMPLGRIGQPEEVAELIVWLLSDKASLVTGAHVNAGGGGFLVAGIA